ncbi:MAG: hypothetical protein IPP71_20755 [Bacteroidetes bacterium]|nr:hypothetical protein [Bacteroidota bacterium]
MFTVTDTGIGIAEEHLHHIFESFTQANAEKASGGTGLGLAIVKHLVELQGRNNFCKQYGWNRFCF